MTRKRLSCPILSTSGLLFIIVLTLARGNSTSFDLRGEFVGVWVLETALRAADTGVVGVSSVMMILVWSAIDKKYNHTNNFAVSCDNNFYDSAKWFSLITSSSLCHFITGTVLNLVIVLSKNCSR